MASQAFSNKLHHRSETILEELGVGFTTQISLKVVREGFTYRETIYNVRLGYRFQPLREGFIARLAWVPTVEKEPLYSEYVMKLDNVGLSVGYSFR